MALSADDLFHRFVLPLYPEDARVDLARARAVDGNPGKNPSFQLHLDDAAERFQVRVGRELGLSLDGSDASVHLLGAALTPARRDGWLAGEGTPDSPLFNILVHGAAYVGRCIVQNHSGVWRIRRPLWESLVFLSSPLGEAELPVFHWLVRCLSDDDAGALSLGDRYRTYVEEPTTDWNALPIIAHGDLTTRTMPRLTKVRYDVFYKYMKAHAPEVRDFGNDFPSPERFAELDFKWIDTVWVGSGRQLLVSALGREGLFLYWLDAAGFRKSAFFPCETFPEPKVTQANDKLTVMVSREGRVETREMLWWGL